MPKLNPSQLHEKIVSLEDQHYPLRDHWNCSRPNLDPRESENNYKHHLAHLEQIYSNFKAPAVKPTNHPINFKSPGTQLYGVNGLKYDEYDAEKINAYREKAWVDNFHVKSSKKSSQVSLDNTSHRNHEETLMTNESKKQSASLPSKGTGIIIEDKVETRGGFYTGYIEPREEEVEYCSKKTTENLSKQDLNMLGLYKLSKKDEEIYKKFVEILKKMDPYDARNMLNDAFVESQTFSFDDYTGTQG